MRSLIYNPFFYRLFCAIEKIAGPSAVPFLMIPFVALDLLRRLHDYSYFVRLRNNFTEEFWKGISPLQHYFGMIWNWHESVVVVLFYHRIGLPCWRDRMAITAKSFHPLQREGKRPIILVFQHAGSFGLIRWWIRSLGIPTASLIDAMPSILDNENYQKILDKGDQLYGLEGVPHVFRRDKIKGAIRFLKAGNILTMAMDGGYKWNENDRINTPCGRAIYLKDGSLRLAARTGAMVVPTSVLKTGSCRFEMRFGLPVPEAMIQEEDFKSGMEHLVQQLWPSLEANPEQINWTTLESLNPKMITNRIGWP